MAKVFAYKGNIIGGGIGEDIKVTQTGSVSTNADYKILLSKSANDTTETDTVNKASGLTYNPSTNQLKINGTAVLTQHQDISGKVDKAGDTMSGNLYRQNTGVTLNTTASNNVSETTYATYSFSDSTNTKIAQLVTGAYTNGTIKTYMEVFNKTTDGTDVYGQFGIQANKNGTVTYSIGSPANFRSALGLGSTALSSLSWDEGLTVVATLGDGIDTIGHSNRITADTIGTSSATSGATLAVPYATYDSNGHIKTKGTHTHTITGFVPTGGGTMSGALNMLGQDIKLSPTSSSNDDSGDIVFYYGNGNEKARIWTVNEYNSASGPQYRVYKKDGTSLYSGTLAINSDTGWVNMTHGQYRVRNGVCYIRVNEKNVGVHTWTTVGTIPAGSRPTGSAIWIPAIGGDHRQYCGSLRVNTDGTVAFYCNTAANYWASGSYPI